MTTIWTIKFFPPKDEKNAPFTYVLSLANKKEQAQLIHRLETIAKLERVDWPSKWYHGIQDNILQLSAGKSRLLFVLDNRNIIIVHAFRKKSQKTRKRDIERAILNYNHYMEREGK